MIRHRELSRILPALSQQKIFTMVVTSGIIPIPMEWMGLRRNRVAVSIDGLPEHHDPRRKPATYERILENIRDREVNIHWTITGPMMKRPGYLEEYLAFWEARPEVKRIWVSLYTPQQGEHTPEMLTMEERQRVARELPGLRDAYPKLLMNPGIGQALLEPPKNPQECLFSKMSTNFSADLTYPSRALYFWRCAGLQPVRLRGFKRTASCAAEKSSGPAENRSPGAGFDGDRFADESPAIRIR